MRTPRGSIAVLVGIALCIAVAIVSEMRPRDPSPDELARLIEASRPTWQNYQEDIKAQIGAAQVAQWQGTPKEIHHNGDTVLAAFRINGPWAERQVAIPVLIRTPGGDTLPNTRASRDGDIVTYEFLVSKDTSLPWVEIRYPGHGELKAMLPWKRQ